MKLHDKIIIIRLITSSLLMLISGAILLVDLPAFIGLLSLTIVAILIIFIVLERKEKRQS